MADQQKPETSESGQWFDLQSEKVVDSPPEEGVQIVAPGGEVTPAVQAELDRYRNDGGPVQTVGGDAPAEPEPEKPAKAVAKKASK